MAVGVIDKDGFIVTVGNADGCTEFVGLEVVDGIEESVAVGALDKNGLDVMVGDIDGCVE